MRPRHVRSIFSTLRSEGGVAAIELAVILPVLFAILFGIISFGTYFYNYIVITNAAREGARWGSINISPTTTLPYSCGTPPSACSVAISYAEGMLISYGGTKTLNASAEIKPASEDEGEEGRVLTLTVTYEYQGIWDFQTIFGDNISSSAKMYLEPR